MLCAEGFIVAHNHPSGNLEPSKADGEVHRKIEQTAKLLDITYLDNLIVSEKGYYSTIANQIIVPKLN